jgi:hypothetical protein
MPQDAAPDGEGDWYHPEIDAETNDSECCFSDLVAGEISYCSNPTNPHKVCFGCAKLNAETEFGKGKYVAPKHGSSPKV